MAGHSNPHIYLTDNYPTAKSNRLSYEQVVRALLAAGWPKNRETLTTATAVVAAESARDPRAYLAYIDLFVDRNSEKGLALRKKIDAIPPMTLTSYRPKIEELGARVVRADCGLFQIAKTFAGYRGEPLTPDISVIELMKADVNARRALFMWKDRGWQPWAAYTTARPGEPEPPYRRFLPYAQEAVNKVLGG